jgi:hypothetical protein
MQKEIVINFNEKGNIEKEEKDRKEKEEWRLYNMSLSVTI